MSDVKVKMGATLTLSSKRDKDIIATVDNLKAKHKLGAFVSALLKVAHDNPEVMELVEKEFNGELSSRDAYFSSLDGRIKECKDNIDALNEEITTLATCFKYGAKSGIVDKVYNVALANIATERHLQQLQRELKGNLVLDNRDKKLLESMERVADKAVERVVDILQDIEVSSIVSSINSVEKAQTNNSLVDSQNSNTGLRTGEVKKADDVKPDKESLKKEVEAEKKVEVEKPIEDKPKALPQIGALAKFCGVQA